MGLETVELVLSVEEEFGFDIPNDEAARIVTVGELSAYVQSRLERQHLRRLSESEAAAIWERIKQLVIEKTGAPEAMLTPNTSFIDDLGMG